MAKKTIKMKFISDELKERLELALYRSHNVLELLQEQKLIDTKDFDKDDFDFEYVINLAQLLTLLEIKEILQEEKKEIIPNGYTKEEWNAVLEHIKKKKKEE